MKKEGLFNEDFLKQFKSGDELNGFLKELQKRGIEKMLEGELDGYLDYERRKRSSNTNKRNGHSKKKVRTSFGGVYLATREATEKWSMPIRWIYWTKLTPLQSRFGVLSFWRMLTPLRKRRELGF